VPGIVTNQNFKIVPVPGVGVDCHNTATRRVGTTQNFGATFRRHSKRIVRRVLRMAGANHVSRFAGSYLITIISSRRFRDRA
jgi:hypothetical protein